MAIYGAIRGDRLTRRGTWSRLGDGTLVFCCPHCGYVISLKFHEVNDVNVVSPKVTCEAYRCDFESVVCLEGELE